MILVIDVGNSSITAGIYDSDNLINTFRIETKNLLYGIDGQEKFNSIRNEFLVTGCIIASVVDEINDKLKQIIKNTFNIEPLMLNCNINTGIQLDVVCPREVGADRIANAYGAYKLYSAPAIVVDMGTATTFDIVDGTGRFTGGAIMPGLRLQLLSLCNNTSKLPKIEPSPAKQLLGDNTENSILAGVVIGHACAIDGLIKKYKKELGENFITVATGGYSSLITEHMTTPFDYINSELTLHGIKLIYELNS